MDLAVVFIVDPVAGGVAAFLVVDLDLALFITHRPTVPITACCVMTHRGTQRGARYGQGLPARTATELIADHPAEDGSGDGAGCRAAAVVAVTTLFPADLAFHRDTLDHMNRFDIDDRGIDMMRCHGLRQHRAGEQGCGQNHRELRNHRFSPVWISNLDPVCTSDAEPPMNHRRSVQAGPKLD